VKKLKQIFILTCFCVSLSCSKESDHRQEYHWEIGIDGATSIIDGNIEGINFKFCLLDEQGRPFTEFLHGENFSFYFEMINYRKSDSLALDGGLLGSLYDNGFGGVVMSGSTHFSFDRPECPDSLLPLCGKNNRYSLTAPWNDDGNDRWTVGVCSVVNLHRTPLSRGIYSTEFTRTFDFVDIHGNPSALSIGPLIFKINFEVKDSVHVTTKDYALAADTSCKWIGIASDRVITVDSIQQLSQYVSCVNNKTINYIDLSKNTLLLAAGNVDAGIKKIENRLYRIAAEEYVLKVIVSVDDKPENKAWTVSTLVAKLPETSSVQLLTEIRRP
jgi:hypothetical protein